MTPTLGEIDSLDLVLPDDVIALAATSADLAAARVARRGGATTPRSILSPRSVTFSPRGTAEHQHVPVQDSTGAGAAESGVALEAVPSPRLVAQRAKEADEKHNRSAAVGGRRAGSTTSPGRRRRKKKGSRSGDGSGGSGGPKANERDYTGSLSDSGWSTARSFGGKYDAYFVGGRRKGVASASNRSLPPGRRGAGTYGGARGKRRRKKKTKQKWVVRWVCVCVRACVYRCIGCAVVVLGTLIFHTLLFLSFHPLVCFPVVVGSTGVGSAVRVCSGAPLWRQELPVPPGRPPRQCPRGIWRRVAPRALDQHRARPRPAGACVRVCVW